MAGLGVIGQPEFFAGGPLAGWRAVPDGDHVAYERLTEPVTRMWLYGEFVDGPIKKESGMYTRRRMWGCGWKVAIPIWVEGDQPPRGTAMPGFVFGEVLECEPIA